MYWASRPLGCDVPRVLALPGGLVFFINKLFRNSFLISEPFVEDGPVSPGPRRLVPLGCLAPGVRLLILVTSFCLQDHFPIFVGWWLWYHFRGRAGYLLSSEFVSLRVVFRFKRLLVSVWRDCFVCVISRHVRVRLWGFIGSVGFLGCLRFSRENFFARPWVRVNRFQREASHPG